MPPPQGSAKPQNDNKILFDYVLVVGLQNEGDKPKSFISYRFPPAQFDTNKDNMANAIVQFCFPEAEQWLDHKFAQKKKEEKGETFSFVLTEADGSRKFGYCRRFIVQDNKGNLVPECFCILSFIPAATLFTDMLNIVEELRKKSSSAVFAFLKSVLAKSFPNPGETLNIQTFEGQSYKLKRSENNFLLESVSFSELFHSCGTTIILDIFAGMLCESRVIVCAQNVSKLSSCVNALSALLYPFTWQHVYIPILPKALLSYCCAPMPFMVGVLASNLPELNTYPLEECVLLNIETGKHLRDLPPDCNFKKTLPSSGIGLRRSLDEILRSGRNSKATDLAISQAFLNFFYMVFGNYTKYMEDHKFNRDHFKKDKPKDVQKFIEHLEQTQMYEMFIKERESMSKNGTLDTCALSKEKFLQVSLKTNETLSEGGNAPLHLDGTAAPYVLGVCRRCGKKRKEKIIVKIVFLQRKVQRKKSLGAFILTIDSDRSMIPRSFSSRASREDGSDENGTEGTSKMATFLAKATEVMSEAKGKMQGGNNQMNSSSPNEIPPNIHRPNISSEKIERKVVIEEPYKAAVTTDDIVTPSSPRKVAPSARSLTMRGDGEIKEPRFSSRSTTALPTKSKPPVPPKPDVLIPEKEKNSTLRDDSQKSKPLPPPPPKKPVVANEIPASPKPPVRKVTTLGSGAASNTVEAEGECCTCHKVFNNEPAISAMGKSWHRHCFVCAHCGNPFNEDKKFAQKDGSPYHIECLKTILPKCEKCGEPLKGKVFNAEGRRYHDHCFVCENCGKSLSHGPFMSKEGLNYCRECGMSDPEN